MDDISKEFLKRIDYILVQNGTGEMPHNFMEEIYKLTFESIAYIAIDKRFGKSIKSTVKEMRFCHVSSTLCYCYKICLMNKIIMLLLAVKNH